MKNIIPLIQETQLTSSKVNSKKHTWKCAIIKHLDIKEKENNI
jgi:hypothetical protein